MASRKMLRNSAQGRQFSKERGSQACPRGNPVVSKRKRQEKPFLPDSSLSAEITRLLAYIHTANIFCLLLFSLNSSWAVAEKHWMNTVYLIAMPCHITYLLFLLGRHWTVFVCEHIWIDIITVTVEQHLLSAHYHRRCYKQGTYSNLVIGGKKDTLST